MNQPFNLRRHKSDGLFLRLNKIRDASCLYSRHSSNLFGDKDLNLDLLVQGQMFCRLNYPQVKKCSLCGKEPTPNFDPHVNFAHRLPRTRCQMAHASPGRATLLLHVVHPVAAPLLTSTLGPGISIRFCQCHLSSVEWHSSPQPLPGSG